MMPLFSPSGPQAGSGAMSPNPLTENPGVPAMTSSAAKTFFLCLTFLALGVALPQPCLAVPVASCHCFQNREYNPADKFVADDYILATTFNSLIAAAYNIPKRQVVMLKMKGGVGQGDLLLGLAIARAGKADLEQLLEQRQQKGAWRTVLAAPGLAGAAQNEPLLAVILSGLAEERAAEMAASALLVSFFRVGDKLVSELRADGLDGREMALALVLARAGGKEVRKLAALHVKAGQSWSEIAHGLGIEPATAGTLVSSLGPGR